MAIFQVATNTPPKAEVIAGWIGHQPWATAADGTVSLLGSFHLDDPDGQVGMQVHMVDVGGQRFQVPLTYRDRREPELDDAFIACMEHSVLGTRYVYDGFGDPRFVAVFAGVVACGYGQALGFAQVDGRWYAWPDEVILRHVGPVADGVLVDDFVGLASESAVTFRNRDLELTAFRALVERPVPSRGVLATWLGQAEPVVLAEWRREGDSNPRDP